MILAIVWLRTAKLSGERERLDLSRLGLASWLDWDKVLNLCILEREASAHAPPDFPPVLSRPEPP
jgi:hypothetical protein